MPSTPEPIRRDDVTHLRGDGTSVILAFVGRCLPQILHWGDDLGALDGDELVALALASRPQIASNHLDRPVALALLPEQSAGWLGTPGLSGHRDGRVFSTAFAVTRSARTAGTGPVREHLEVEAVDDTAELAVLLEFDLLVGGAIRHRAHLINNAGTGVYTLDALLPTLPVPTEAQEILDLTGRHLRERSPQRHRFTVGTHLRENRRGRTGLDSAFVLAAGDPGFGWESGRIWAVHVAWSGNHRILAERLSTGEALLAGGELLLPGEGRLQPGETYVSPWVYGAHGNGLNDVAHRFHTYMRARPNHPSSPRPIVLNTWEAVYFRQDPDALARLAEEGAAVGAERFVLDDGWFLGRRDDHAGLGDWAVDPAVWPDGLHTLVNHVRGLGLQFGMWFEPEMINPDSHLARAHPEWILQPDGPRLPIPARYQQVLDLANPDAWQHLLRQMDALITEYKLDYLKWDHNRDLVEPGSPTRGGAAVHAQTLAAYGLMDELRARHPGLEIESCSSGGGRVDLAILERTDRVWASDCIDAVERQQIDGWTKLLLPPELVGSHIGSPVAHSTGRSLDLAFRAATAIWGHLGIEWDLRAASELDRTGLAAWVEFHKEHRRLLHSGRVVRTDHPDPSLQVHGVIAHDGSQALFALVQLNTPVWSPPGRVRLPGLEPQAQYLVTLLTSDVLRFGPALASAPWWTGGPLRIGGSVLATVGVQAPAQNPQHVALVHLRRIETHEPDSPTTEAGPAGPVTP